MDSFKTHNRRVMTLGSLFDGIGGFPYVGLLHGIKPLWASEILPQAISVTMKHFPNMEHVGDLTQLNGADLPPVDIITFGSPCQDLSTAGRRAGLDGERSSLFYEAIRIIDEMRDATNGQYPKYAVWENVPGALSSGKPRGSDFRAVLEAFTKTKVPMPDSGGWANAGLLISPNFGEQSGECNDLERRNNVNIAWRILNAQYHGVPQRRRRIFLVASFGAKCPSEILFIEKSLRRDSSTCCQEGQGIATDAERGIRSTVQGEPCCLIQKHDNSATKKSVNPIAFVANQRDEIRDLGLASGALQAQPGMKQQTFIAQPPQSRDSIVAAFLKEPSENARSIGYSEDVSPTLKSSPSCLCEKHTEPTTVYGLCANNSNSMLSNNPHSGIYKADTSRTLDQNGGNPACNQGGMIVLESPFSQNLQPSVILNDQGGDSISVEKSDISPTLRSETHGHLPIVAKKDDSFAYGVHQGQGGDVNVSKAAYSLTTNSGASSRNAPLVTHKKSIEDTLVISESEEVEVALQAAGLTSKGNGDCFLTPECHCALSQGGGQAGQGYPAVLIPYSDVHPKVTGTLVASGSGLSRPGGMASEPDLCVAYEQPAYALQGNMIGRQDHNGPQGNGINEDVCFTMTSTDIGGVAAMFNRKWSDDFKEDSIASTQTAGNCKYAMDLVCEIKQNTNHPASDAIAQNHIYDGTCNEACFSASSFGGLKEGVGTLRTQGGDNGGGSESLIVSEGSAKYIVRRLTPTECERLQGFPDGWTRYGHDGKEISDTRRYQMLGNSVAIPCVAFVLGNIAEKFYDGGDAVGVCSCTQRPYESQN